MQSVDGRINCHIIYVLKLQDECWYVGWTTSFAFNKRMAHHWESNDKGAMWTRAHKPIRIASIDTYPRHLSDSAVGVIEDKKTLEYARMYGLQSVRGGGYCQEFPAWPLDMGQKKKKNVSKKKLKSNRQLRELARAKRELRASSMLLR